MAITPHHHWARNLQFGLRSYPLFAARNSASLFVLPKLGATSFLPGVGELGATTCDEVRGGDRSWFSSTIACGPEAVTFLVDRKLAQNREDAVPGRWSLGFLDA